MEFIMEHPILFLLLSIGCSVAAITVHVWNMGSMFKSPLNKPFDSFMLWFIPVAFLSICASVNMLLFVISVVNYFIHHN